MSDKGRKAERRVERALREALPNADYRLYTNVSWTGPVREAKPARDGEADAIVVHPTDGFLVVEVKSGTPTRSANGRWRISDHALPVSPFKQAENSKHALEKKLRDLPRWPAGARPVAGHAVAFPDVDLACLPFDHPILGADAPRELILDATALQNPELTRKWLERAFRYWAGDRTGRQPLGREGVHLIEDLLAPTRSLRRLVGSRIRDDRDELVAISEEQAVVIDHCCQMPRVEVVGPAGSGKSMLAAERAKRLATEGYFTLLVCFNQRLATTLRRELDGVRGERGLLVSTFHTLCEDMATNVDILPERPAEPGRDWWDKTLPGLLAEAARLDPGARFDAIVVDEGQDFPLSWLEMLQGLLRDRDSGVFWVFHDPAQAIRQEDVVSQLCLTPLQLFEGHRNSGEIAAMAAHFRTDGQTVRVKRDNGEAVEVIEAKPGQDADALAMVLRILRRDERVAADDIVVLSGKSASDSEVWARREYGGERLENSAINDDGTSKRLPPQQVPPEPAGSVLFETIRRFKGMERDAVILVELPEEHERLNELMYVAITRATTHLTIIAPPVLARRIRDG